MALINCPECKSEISEKANSCPKCGCPIKVAAKENNSGCAKFIGWFFTIVTGLLFISILTIDADKSASIDKVARKIEKNPLNIDSSHLIATKNDNGAGYIVCVKRNSYNGIWRPMAWLVINDKLVVANGASKHVTPSIGYNNIDWQKAGIKKDNLLDEAKKQCIN